MVNFYVFLIKVVGSLTIDGVPPLWRDAVAAKLEPKPTTEE